MRKPIRGWKFVDSTAVDNRRKTLGWSYDDLAEKSGVGRDTVIKWLGGGTGDEGMGEALLGALQLTPTKDYLCHPDWPKQLIAPAPSPPPSSGEGGYPLAGGEGSEAALEGRCAAGRGNSPSVNIPDMLHGCLGRDDAATQIIEALCKDRPRPVLLYGGPGIGKTTLKKYVLLDSRMEKQFGARRYWVEADKAYNADTLTRLIADSIGLGTLDPNPEAARVALLKHLTGIAAPVAIGLDNIETPLGMAVQPDDVPKPDTGAESEKAEKRETETKELLKALGEVPQVAVLASFRGGVRTAAGTFWHGVRVDSLAEDPAVDLFLAVANDLETTPPKAQVATLVQQVAYVPLAVVLLASYAETAGSFTELERQWQQRGVALLEHGAGKADSWQAALRFSLESPILKAHPLASRLVRLMGQLPDGIHPTDAREVLSDTETAITEAHNLLLRLGLIQNATHGELLRWAMLHPVREFLRTTEAYAPDAADWEGCAEKYLRLLDTHGPKVGDEREAIEALYPEIDNVGAALLRELRENRNSRQWVVRFWYYGLFIYWVIEKGDLRVLEEGARQNTRASRWSPGILEADCIKSLGDIHLSKSELDLAQQRYEQAMPIYQAAGSKIGEANCIQSLGDIHLRKSELDLAQQRYEQAMPMFQAAGDKIGEANCIKGFGDVAAWRGDTAGAKEYFEAALKQYEAIGHRENQAETLLCLSYLPADTPEMQEVYRQQAQAALAGVFTPEEYARFEADVERRYRPPAVG